MRDRNDDFNNENEQDYVYEEEGGRSDLEYDLAEDDNIKPTFQPTFDDNLQQQIFKRPKTETKIKKQTHDTHPIVTNRKENDGDKPMSETLNDLGALILKSLKKNPVLLLENIKSLVKQHEEVRKKIPFRPHRRFKKQRGKLNRGREGNGHESRGRESSRGEDNLEGATRGRTRSQRNKMKDSGHESGRQGNTKIKESGEIESKSRNKQRFKKYRSKSNKQQKKKYHTKNPHSHKEDIERNYADSIEGEGAEQELDGREIGVEVTDYLLENGYNYLKDNLEQEVLGNDDYEDAAAHLDADHDYRHDDDHRHNHYQRAEPHRQRYSENDAVKNYYTGDLQGLTLYRSDVDDRFEQYKGGRYKDLESNDQYEAEKADVYQNGGDLGHFYLQGVDDFVGEEVNDVVEEDDGELLETYEIHQHHHYYDDQGNKLD